MSCYLENRSFVETAKSTYYHNYHNQMEFLNRKSEIAMLLKIAPIAPAQFLDPPKASFPVLKIDIFVQIALIVP